jgi:FKBP-type peptidyl-prolyl cis-trans isomerase FkpA
VLTPEASYNCQDMGKGLLVGFAVGLLVISGGLFGFMIYQKQQKTSAAQASLSGSADEAEAADVLTFNMAQTGQDIPLGGNDKKEDNGSMLKVDGSTPSATQSTLNGQAQAGQQSSSSQKKVVPGPETFGEYDKYVNEKAPYFGDIQLGTGDEAVKGMTAAVSYTGWLTTGSQFDKSDPKKPFVFKIGAGSVIRGWDEGILGMKVGGRRRLIVPPAVGYGAQDHDVIPANSVLVFDLELVAVQK